MDLNERGLAFQNRSYSRTYLRRMRRYGVSAFALARSTPRIRSRSASQSAAVGVSNSPA